MMKQHGGSVSMQGGEGRDKCSHGRDQSYSHPSRWEKNCTEGTQRRTELA